uniref:Uncharacterized protein n=1 Tax=Gasterosteus aculeatus aculeatus TaxID=481459 RepID=A0AAQ4RWV5_GASAC
MYDICLILEGLLSLQALHICIWGNRIAQYIQFSLRCSNIQEHAHVAAVSVAEEAGLQQHPLQKTEQPAKSQPSSPERNGQAEIMQRAAWAPSPCAHLHLGGQTGHKWAEGFTACSDPAKHDGMDEIPGMRACSTTREHRIPLPAIELGGTVLVTTKTV